jgi:FtsP/CotA-like multicopper oxidase with cupredoxin domain
VSICTRRGSRVRQPYILTGRLPRVRRAGIATAVAVLLVSFGCVRAQETVGSKALHVTSPRIEANRNLSPAGQLRDGVLTVHLEIREGDWYPEADTGPAVVVQAFAEAGRPLQIPGPLIRVPEGTEVRATVRNVLDKGTARVYGLHGRPGDGKKPLEIAAGEIREVRFKLTAPGTYHYWATTTGVPMERRFFADSQLSGALIVDPPGEAVADRVFVIGVWLDVGVRGAAPRNGQNIAVINGKSWPYTERFTYEAGKPVRWRWINTSYDHHPLHLHGAYFRVRSEGDGEVDVALPAEKQRLAVTERIPAGGTRSIALLLEREGRWIFHCHMLMHMSAEYRYLEPIVPGAGLRPAVGMHHYAVDPTGMAGLVLGITVLPRARSASPPTSTLPARKLTLLARERPATDRIPAGAVFQLQDGPQAPALDAATVPGPPLVLTRGEPVEITVVNHMREPTGIHWHGIELDSYYDGVPGWGGSGAQVTPPIEPGQSFVARFTPPRAGTFIYHTHWHNFLQLTGGLYGPLIVLSPGQKFDPETDIPVMIGLGGAFDLKSPILLNGSAQPEPLRLKAGVKYRLRFINITANGNGFQVSLLGGASPVRWRPVAKDGEDLPPAQAIEQQARLTIAVGETYDFEFEPATKGDLRLEVLRPFNRTWVVVEVQVR